MQVAAVRCGQYTQTIRHALQLSLPLLYPLRQKNAAHVFNRAEKRYGSSGTSESSPFLVKPFLNMNFIRSRKKVVSDAAPETNTVAGKKPTFSPAPPPSHPEYTIQKLPAEKHVKEGKTAPTVMTHQYVFSAITAEILRHTARDLGYQIVPDGFVRVMDIVCPGYVLQLPRKTNGSWTSFATNFTEITTSRNSQPHVMTIPWTLLNWLGCRNT